MKRNPICIIAVAILAFATNSFAQPGHALEVDNGLGAYSLIKGSASGGIYTLANGGGTILTTGSGLIWLTAGHQPTTPATDCPGAPVKKPLTSRLFAHRELLYYA